MVLKKLIKLHDKKDLFVFKGTRSKKRQKFKLLTFFSLFIGIVGFD